MPPKILLLEDRPTDAELVKVELIWGGITADLQRVDSQEAYEAALETFSPDIILSDFNVPGFSGLAALEIRNQKAPGTPFIFVTGSLGEELAVSTLRSGATDFVLKDRMARLPAAVTAAMESFARRGERDRMNLELLSERNLMQAVLDAAQAMIIVLDDSGHIMHINAAAERITHLPRATLVGMKFWDAMSQSEQVDTIRHEIHAALDLRHETPQRSWPMITPTERKIICSSSALAHDHRGERLVVCGIDITEQERAEQHAFFLGHFDPVTNLPNRMHFVQQLGEYCKQRAADATTVLVVMMIGVERVQDIGDSYGDAAINQVLTEVVQRLRVWQSHADLLARVADNSFALAFEVGRGPDLDMLAPHILEQLREQVSVGDSQWVLPVVHAGISLYPDNASEAGPLLKAAESALHCAPTDTDQIYAFYSPLLSDQIRERLLLESELREALKTDDQLILHYQPQVDIATGRTVGLEALVRWRHPRLDWLSPARFIPQAEACGLMVPLGRWVMRSACRQLSLWKAQGLSAPTVSVNLSAGQFSGPSLIDDVDTTLREFSVEPSLLELELTESASMRDPELSISIMEQLRGMGIKIAIDDFGTGYSNLSYLKRFPVDRLKLDQAFVRDIMTDADDLAISRAIVAMALQLRLEVVAEGVETREQLRMLANAGCRTVQGYLYSRPVAAEHCLPFMQTPFPIY
ncbi:EAL domain-containing protein [Uliginosibacterium sp. H3]|uniref:EAL domain-containing protein n=1 Tax=Uliginosibacterium silvisoli TaxID=3114758 RepID=A0ABU6K5I9_9RHOO|nr:EAL domain-containing protein [Uliginosibacterium sp. H3]